MHFKTASLVQLILRSVANTANVAILGLVLYCAIEFNRLFGMTLATVRYLAKPPPINSTSTAFSKS